MKRPSAETPKSIAFMSGCAHMKSDWKITAMKVSWRQNQSSSTTIQRRKFPLKPISRTTEFFQSAA